MVGRAHAWAGGTFLHHVLPEHVGTGPALPACLLADSGLQEPSPRSSPPTPTCPHHWDQLLSLPLGQEEKVCPGRKTMGENSEFTPPPPDIGPIVKSSPGGNHKFNTNLFLLVLFCESNPVCLKRFHIAVASSVCTPTLASISIPHYRSRD